MRDKISKTLVPGVVFLVFAAAMYLLMPSQIKTTETSAFTARTFPSLALGIIGLCGLILVLQGAWALLREKRAEQAAAAEKREADAPAKRGNLLLFLEVLVLLIVSAVVDNYSSLLVSGLLLGAGFLVLYRDKKPLHYVVVLAIVVVSYFLFKQVFGLQLP